MNINDLLIQHKELLQAEKERHGEYAQLRNEITKWKMICFLLVLCDVGTFVTFYFMLIGE